MCPTHSEAKRNQLSEFGAEKGYCKALQGDLVAHDLKSLELPEGFQQNVFKSRVGARVGGGRVTGYVINSGTILCVVVRLHGGVTELNIISP